MVKIYNFLLKVLASLSIAFCVLLFILSIFELYWIYTIGSIFIFGISFLIYRYSKFLAEKFYNLNKLALFSTISILAITLNPFIDKAFNNRPVLGAILNMPTQMYIIGVTSILISSSLTFLAARLKNQFISWLLSIILGLFSPIIFFLLSGLAYRHISPGEGAYWLGMILFFYSIIIAIISIIVNICIKINSKKIADREAVNFAILVITGIIFLISVPLFLLKL